MGGGYLWLAGLIYMIISTVDFAAAADEIISPEVRACASITNSQRRLECFDSFIERNGINPRLNSNIEDRGAWNVVEDRSPIDNSPTLIASLPANSVAGFGPFDRPTAQLVIRCRERRLDVFIASSEFFGAFAERRVVLRLGQDPAQEEVWSPVSGGRAIGLWGHGSAISFIRRLIEAETTSLVIRADTFRGTPITAEFTTTGAASVLEPVVTLCPPPPARPTSQSSARPPHRR